MTDNASPVHRLAKLASQTAQCVRLTAAVAVVITYRIIQSNVVSGDRLLSQLVVIGIIGAAGAAFLLYAANRLSTAAAAAVKSI
jgi:hypothetical protein